MRGLVIIPARGGSKGIPQKNLTMLDRKPLIYYAIKNAMSLNDVDVVVATDDVRIHAVASVFGAETMKRPPETATDEATIDDVIAYVVNHLAVMGRHYDMVISMQATSPLLKGSTLKRAVEKFTTSGIDTLISACEKRHLMWQRDNSQFVPVYKDRVNRQQLTPLYEENGAFVICKARLIHDQKTRIGKKVDIFLLGNEEGIDIDNKDDWVVAESIMQRKSIAFVTAGDFHIGMGHIHRSITLCSKLSNHNSRFFCPIGAQLGIDKIKSMNHKLDVYRDADHLKDLLRQYEIDIVVNDILDTEADYIEGLKDDGYFVVNFEDTGDGATKCDLLFNALYEWSVSKEDAYYGYQYECLRDDMYLYPVRDAVAEKVENIVIGFGGTDINNATAKVLCCLNEITINSNVVINLILGVGYQYEAELTALIDDLNMNNQINIHKDVPLMASHLYDADLVISGNGRMVYEIVSIGTPLIVFSQTEREASHTFPKICPGIKYLGNIQNVREEDICESFKMIIDSYSYRKKMNEHLVEFAIEIRHGLDRIEKLLWETYTKKQNYHYEQSAIL